MKLHTTDSGRSESIDFCFERNDCTVRALANVLNLPYAEAWSALRDAGRTAGKGVHMHKAIPKLKAQGYVWQPVIGPEAGYRGMRVENFARCFPRGKYYCLIRGHAFAFIDGVKYDTGMGNPRAIIYAAWCVFKQSTIDQLLDL